jgi:hypothetical protein
MAWCEMALVAIALYRLLTQRSAIVEREVMEGRFRRGKRQYNREVCLIVMFALQMAREWL